jgi:hypothetical protein
MARAKAADGEPNQMDLVRGAMEALGAKAKPQAIQDYIKENHNGRILTKQLISNYKFHIRRKGKVVARRGRKPGAATGGTVRLDDLEVVRALVNRIGADQVKRLVEVLG